MDALRSVYDCAAMIATRAQSAEVVVMDQFVDWFSPINPIDYCV